MTMRTLREEPARSVVDFSSLTNDRAVARVRQLAAQGLRESTMESLTGWHRTDIRRAIAPAPARSNR
jgi:hypothetical protein